MKKKNIYIPIEIFVREINSKILFAFYAALKNYRIFIGTKTGIDKIIDKKIKLKQRSGVYFYKSQILNNVKYKNKVKKAFEKIIVLDEELGSGVSNLKSTFETRIKTLSGIDKFFVIGKKMKKNILNFNPKYKNKIIVSGWLKYDYYKDKNLNIFNKEVAEIKRNYGDFFLFSSNYGALSKEGFKSIIKNDSSILKNKNLNNKKNDYYTFKQSLNDFKYLKYSLFDFLKQNQNLNLIIRPHPSDKLYDDWNVFGCFPNVKIINKYDIVPWIISSKGLIHRGCSTSIDAFFLKKPVFYFLPNRKIADTEKNFTYKISKKIYDFTSIKNSKFDFTYNAGKNFLNEIETKNATYKNIIKELNTIKFSKDESINFNILEQFRNYFIPYLGKLKSSFKRIIFNQKIVRNQKIFKFITKKELKQKISYLNNTNNKIKIKEITKDVFEIEKI